MNVCIPHLPNGQLAEAYNKIMRETSDQWVLMVESDVLLTNRNFYGIFERAIKNAPEDTGMISCVCNSVNCDWQIDGFESDSISEHLQHSRQRYRKYGDELVDVTDGMLASGFVMLINRDAWKDVPPGGQFGRDNWIHQQMKDNGWRIFVLPGLYVYHLHKRNGPGSMLSEEKTIVELYKEHKNALCSHCS